MIAPWPLLIYLSLSVLLAVCSKRCRTESATCVSECSAELVAVCFVIGIHKNSVFPTGWDQELDSRVGGKKKPGLSRSKSESHLDTNV